MDIRLFSSVDEVAREAARVIASIARNEVAVRGRFVFAVSGGKTPWQMLRALGNEDVPWENMHVFQVDERIAPDGHPDRNLTHLRESLLENAPLREDHIYAMPVESADLQLSAISYAEMLCKIAGNPPVMDLIHLGLGPDGHTASLIPEDPVLNEESQDVALTGVYQGRKRMTLTYPLINRARNILWVVTGAEKVSMLNRLLGGDRSIPAGRVCRDNALILADYDAAGK